MPQSLAAILFFHGECVNLKISQLQLQLFFSIWVFFHEHSQFTGQQEKGKVICLTGLYHFYPLCSYLSISRATKAETLLLYIAKCRTRTRNFDCCTPSQLHVFIRCATVICCHSLSFVVTRCHLLSLDGRLICLFINNHNVL